MHQTITYPNLFTKKKKKLCHYNQCPLKLNKFIKRLCISVLKNVLTPPNHHPLSPSHSPLYSNSSLEEIHGRVRPDYMIVIVGSHAQNTPPLVFKRVRERIFLQHYLQLNLEILIRIFHIFSSVPKKECNNMTFQGRMTKKVKKGRGHTKSVTDMCGYQL